MEIILKQLKPIYMSKEEILNSNLYLEDSVSFLENKKYLIKANSGHGKTSILNFIYGVSLNFDGTIEYITNKEEEINVSELRKFYISYVFQDYKLFPSLTVFENILLKNRLTDYKRTKDINYFLDQVNLSHKKDELVQNLSLGQKQRVAIIRSLCQPFKYLLLDEPFSHIDNSNIEIVSRIIDSELEKQNASLIMTSLEDTSVFNFDTVFNI